ncbi:hypothetical protein [Blastococcus goldschmidtiae]|uniref:Fibronectin type-III domain-containing protein n=1 Tax=Blastococcus goldschmidtiae TaxID=3075546 RepID=A0ABU2KB13_9ACTN|nr:hypothetical protein [Blastococcus sp. DSM 46792]MDT0277380.1 hypothetical protein [Blastococcus sp. DSM 46792]
MRLGRLLATGTAVALVWPAVLTAGTTIPAAAAPEAAQTYPGPAYSADFPTTPTAEANQTKLWFHAGAWWALLLEPTGRTVRVHELMPDHSWRPTSAIVNADTGAVGDALHDGDLVHVATRTADEALRYVRLSFDPAARDYRVGVPSLITPRGSLEPASLAEDTTGRLWAAYASYSDVLISYSDDGGLTWAPLESIAATGTGQDSEMAALVSYDDRVGLMWSDQRTGTFEFASHQDGDAPTAWVRETVPPGPAGANDHISLTRIPGEPSDSLVAAVMTSAQETGESIDAPLTEVLVRRPGGQWSRTTVSTVADDLYNPVVAVEESTRTLHVFMSLYGSIVAKRASWEDVRFPSGQGQLVVNGADTDVADGPEAGLVDPTVGQEPVNAGSGLVVLASDRRDKDYRHAEVPIGSGIPPADPDDSTPPEAPATLQASVLSPTEVVLTWPAATDGNRWWPAADGVPVGSYVVSRDGAEIGTVSSTSFVDQDARPETEDAATVVTYDVQAVDASGNRSPAARVEVQLPALSGSDLPLFAGVGLLALAALAAGVAVYRRYVPAAPQDAQEDEALTAGDAPLTPSR